MLVLARGVLARGGLRRARHRLLRHRHHTAARAMLRWLPADGRARTALAGAALATAGALCTQLWPMVQQELGKRNDAADVRKLFRDMDKNGDGRLSIDEIQTQIQALCPPTAGDDRVSTSLAKRMLDAADTDRDGILTEDEFINGMAGELRPYLAVCLVPGGLTPHRITFTIPTSLLDSPLEEKASPGKLHVRVRLGAVHGKDRSPGQCHFSTQPAIHYFAVCHFATTQDPTMSSGTTGTIHYRTIASISSRAWSTMATHSRSFVRSPSRTASRRGAMSTAAASAAQATRATPRRRASCGTSPSRACYLPATIQS